ncbi:MAG: phospholipase D-like domain-containing protein [Flavobacteriales bacterium]
MARFLTATDTSAGIEQVIRNASKHLVLISAYVYPRIIYIERLQDAAERGVKMQLVFGKREMDNRVRKQFERIPELEIFFLKELHVKCYLNERQGIITSLNLLNSSEASNREMGVLLDSEEDAEAFNDMNAEVRSILRRATRIEGKGRASSSLIEDFRERVRAMTDQPEGLVVDKRLNEMRLKYPRAYYSWSDAEHALVKEMREAGLDQDEAAKILGRKPSALGWWG